MMTRTVFLIIVCLSTFTVNAFEFHHVSKHTSHCIDKNGSIDCKLSGDGEIDFSKTREKFNAKNIFLNLNHHMEGELRLYRSHNGGHSIKGEFLLDNTLGENLFVQYRVVFKDKKGPVAQTKGELHLKSGKRQKLKFSTIVLKEQDIKDITSYEIHLFASKNDIRYY